jgi:hypothetical protein
MERSHGFSPRARRPSARQLTTPLGRIKLRPKAGRSGRQHTPTRLSERMAALAAPRNATELNQVKFPDHFVLPAQLAGQLEGDWGFIDRRPATDERFGPRPSTVGPGPAAFNIAAPRSNVGAVLVSRPKGRSAARAAEAAGPGPAAYTPRTPRSGSGGVMGARCHPLGGGAGSAGPGPAAYNISAAAKASSLCATAGSAVFGGGMATGARSQDGREVEEEAAAEEEAEAEEGSAGGAKKTKKTKKKKKKKGAEQQGAMVVESGPGPGAYTPRLPGEGAVRGPRMGAAPRWRRPVPPAAPPRTAAAAAAQQEAAAAAEAAAVAARLAEQVGRAADFAAKGRAPAFSLGARRAADPAERSAAELGPGPAAYSTQAHLGMGSQTGAAAGQPQPQSGGGSRGGGARKAGARGRGGGGSGFGSEPRLRSRPALTAEASLAPARSTLSSRGGGWAKQRARGGGFGAAAGGDGQGQGGGPGPAAYDPAPQLAKSGRHCGAVAWGRPPSNPSALQRRRQSQATQQQALPAFVDAAALEGPGPAAYDTVRACERALWGGGASAVLSSRQLFGAVPAFATPQPPRGGGDGGGGGGGGGTRPTGVGDELVLGAAPPIISERRLALRRMMESELGRLGVSTGT